MNLHCFGNKIGRCAGRIRDDGGILSCQRIDERRLAAVPKSGQIANCCGPNALMTLKEYLEDYASEDTRQKGGRLILNETERIPNSKIRESRVEIIIPV